MKTIIIAHHKQADKYEAFTSLKKFVDAYPVYNLHTMYHWITRKKKPYENESIKVVRVNVNASI